MRPLEEVRGLVLGSVPRLGTETVPLGQALGRVLAQPIVSSQDVPHFANSAMDGYAVRATDVAGAGSVLELIGEVPAGGVASVEVAEGQAMRIMTGAPMPGGADTVVRVEDTEESEGKVQIRGVVAAGTHVRAPGGDLRRGEEVFPEGTRLSATHLGVLATVGITDPLVSNVPRVAVMSTGDELAPAESEELGPGMIRDSNRPMLLAMLAETGVEPLDLGAIGDDADLLRAAVGRAVLEADVIVSSGGVSMGDYDMIKTVLAAESGVEMLQVAMKPGKPFAFGLLGGRPFFGLPGNPVSVLVSFEQLVRPALLSTQGATRVLRPRLTGTAGERMESDPEKVEFVRARLEEGRVVRTGGQGSHVLSAAANADFFALLDVGVSVVEESEEVVLELFRSAASREVGE
ncbi:MAG: molybdopterin molybdotransferase MoeA [Acidimicrobiia bacterium]